MPGASSWPKRTRSVNPSHSPRAQARRARVGGIAAEEIAANHLRYLGLTQVERIPVEWKIVRVAGRVVDARPARKAGVDIHADWRGRSVRCEVKWTSDPAHGLSWGELQPHQRRYLDDTRASGGLALVAWAMPGEVLVIPWGEAPAWCDGSPIHVEAARALHAQTTAPWRCR